ncbi:MAG: FAD-binding protein, partial [Spirochaetaceae bacterium]|nr:FAD-binding protein [Spirochaetaceae bacterium]
MTDLAENVNLARFSSFNVGGNADFFTQPKTENDFFDAIEWAKSKNMPIFILGGGTNLVISDDGI